MKKGLLQKIREFIGINGSDRIWELDDQNHPLYSDEESLLMLADKWGGAGLPEEASAMKDLLSQGKIKIQPGYFLSFGRLASYDKDTDEIHVNPEIASERVLAHEITHYINHLRDPNIRPMFDEYLAYRNGMAISGGGNPPTPQEFHSQCWKSI